LPGRTSKEAVDAFTAPLRQSLSCILGPAAVLKGTGDAPTGGPYLVVLYGQTGPAPLGGPHNIGLVFQHTYVVVPTGEAGSRYRVHSRSYSYELTTTDERPLLRYDWHPDSDDEGAIPYPHLHLSGHTKPVDLTHAHLPTGRVSLEEVLRFAISQLAVPVHRDHQADWAQILEANEAAFRAHSSWGGSRPEGL
jgi:hypothetical protein